jgi:transposase
MGCALQRANRPRKKTRGAKERDVVERLLFQDLASTLAANRVVVVDESSTHLGMTPTHARAPAGQRAYASVLRKRNYSQNVTLLSALRLSGMDAPLVLDGAVNSLAFETYVGQVLCPILSPGDIVLMDNLSCHKSVRVSALIESRGASILWLPRYSPDLSPIELAFSKLKAFLRRAKAITLDALIDAIGQALNTVTSLDALGWFTHCGFLNLDHAT